MKKLPEGQGTDMFEALCLEGGARRRLHELCLSLNCALLFLFHMYLRFSSS